MSPQDQNRRLADLEIAITSLARALANEGYAPIIEQAVRSAISEGGDGAVELLRGHRLGVAYRRAAS
jgi:hypothetical protein